MRVSASLIATAALALNLLCQPVGSQTAVPIGEQSQINTYTTDDQGSVEVAVDADGDFVVVWESLGSDGSDSSGRSIQGRIYSSTGVPVGPQAQVNSFTTNDQRFPAVGVASGGGLVVVWYSAVSGGSDGDGDSIQGQRYDSSGQPVGGEFQVNTYTTGGQRHPAVATNTDGAFVVVWQSYGSYGADSQGTSIQGQRFDSGGSPAGSEFEVNTYTPFNQKSPAVAIDTDGAFVVVWDSEGSGGSDNDGYSIQGRIYNSTGVPIGPQAQVNTYTTGIQWGPDVSADAEGNFVVVWSSNGSGGSDDSSHSVQGRIYSSLGVPIGPQAQVNTYTTGDQWRPAVGVDADGDFSVIWESAGSGGSDSDGFSIQGRVYGSNAVPAGGDFQINSYTTSQQKHPAVGVDDEGDFVAVWISLGSAGSDTSSSSIQGQLFALPSIFSDGFESGDTAVWSASVP